MNKNKRKLIQAAKEMLEIYSINETIKAILNQAIEKYASIYGEDEPLKVCRLKYIERLHARVISEKLCYNVRTVYKLLDRFLERFIAILFDEYYILAVLLEVIDPMVMFDYFYSEGMKEFGRPPCGMPIPEKAAK